MWHHAYDVMRSTSVSTTAPRLPQPAPGLLTRAAATLLAALALALALAAASAPTAPRTGQTAVVVAPGAPLPAADAVRVARDPLEAQRTAEVLRAQGYAVRIAR
jgi:hypothetical protein